MLIKLIVVIGLFVAIAFALRHAPRSGRQNGDSGSWPDADGDGRRNADGHGHSHDTFLGDSGGHDGGGDSGGGDGGGGDGGGD